MRLSVRLSLAGLAGLALLFVVAGCDDEEESENSPDAPQDPPTCTTDDVPLPPDCRRLVNLVELLQTTHPGRAVEVDVRLMDTCGAPSPSAYAACLSAQDGVAFAERSYTASRTMVLLRPPAGEEDRAATLAALEALLAMRPADEPIAVHRWGERVTPISDFTLDRENLLVRSRMLLGEPDEAPVDPASALAVARAAAEATGGVAELELRSVVVMAAGVPAPDETWLHAVAPAVWEDNLADPTAAAAEASAALDAVRAAGAVGIGAVGETELALKVNQSGLSRNVSLIPWLTEEEDLQGDAARAARGERTYPRRIEISMTPVQRALYEQRVASLSKGSFDVSVKVGDAAPVPAVARLRGHGSMHCTTRPSYKLDLEGPEPRHILPGAATDEFILMSECFDNVYVAGNTGYQLYQKVGLFPFHHHYVEVVVDGQTQGVYMMMEKLREDLVADHAEATALLRRKRADPGYPAIVKWVADGAPDPLPYYDALAEIPNQLSGHALLDEMWNRLSVSGGLTWLATNTAVKQGDSGDEVMFFATSQPGEIPLHFEFVGWDPKDMLRIDCPWKQYVVEDPWGLIYCAEGPFEWAVAGSPELYGLYVRELERVVGILDDEEFKKAADATAAELIPFFEDPAVRLASTELGSPATFEDAKAMVENRLHLLSTRFHDWRAGLLERIAAFRNANP